MRFDGALVNGNSALTEETPKSSLAPSVMVTIYKLGRRFSLGSDLLET